MSECPYIRGSNEGTQHCALAEESVARLTLELAEARRGLQTEDAKRHITDRLLEQRTAERDAARAELARERERADRYRKDFNTTQAALANAQDEVLRLRRARRDEER